jgi:hypothetical protein
MVLDPGKRITEHVLNDIQNSLDYKSKLMLAERFVERTNQVLADQGLKNSSSSTPLNQESSAILSGLKETGYFTLGQVLSDTKVSDIKSHFDKCDIFKGHFASKSDGVPRQLGSDMEGSLNASYRLSDIMAAPHILEAANDPQLLDVASAYMGCLPSLFSINVYWSFAGAEVSNDSVHSFHRDMDDFRFCSFFIYLSDCPQNDGAHQYIRSTHRPDLMATVLDEIDPGKSIDRDKFFSSLMEQGDGAYEEMFGDLIDYLPGAAGDGFITDPWGLHRACPDITNDRMLIWIRFGLYRNPAVDRIAEPPISWEKISGRIPDSPESRYINRLIID